MKSVPSKACVSNRTEIDSELVIYVFRWFLNVSFFLTHQMEMDLNYNEEMNKENIIEWLLPTAGW